MRRGHGWLTTLFMLIPMTAVPLMAVFGIPQFAPVSASPTPVERELESFRFRETRYGQSDAYPVRPVALGQRGGFDPAQRVISGDERAAAGDLFAPLDGRRDNIELASATGRPSVTVWNDPLRETAPASSANRDSNQSLAGRASAPEPGRLFEAPAGPFEVGTDRVTPASFDSERRTSAENLRYVRAEGDRPALASEFLSDVPEPLTWTGAISELNAMGIQNYRLTPGAQPGVFRFMCFVTSIDDPRISRRFDSEAREPLEAVRLVLAQVTEWNRSQ